MGTKQVRLDEDVYAKLEDEKRPGESFSDVIDRLTSDWSLAEWGGWMDESAAQDHRELLGELEEVDDTETDELLEQLGVSDE